MNAIAGIGKEAGTAVGAMPHPESVIAPLHGKTGCRPPFECRPAA